MHWAHEKVSDEAINSTRGKAEMIPFDACTNLFLETFALLEVLLTLPIGSATLECSYSQMKMVNTRLHSRLSDVNLASLMKLQ